MAAAIIDVKSGSSVLSELIKVRGVDDFVPSRNEPRETNTLRALRLIMVAGVALSLVASSLVWMLLPVLFLVSYVIYANVEAYRSKPDADAGACTMPTADNPYMNVVYGDDPERPRACKHAAVMAKEMYYKNLPRDADDLHNSRATDWAFYTTASTQVPNDQDAFLEFLGAPPRPDWLTDKNGA